MALLSHPSFQGTLNGTPVPKLLLGHVTLFLILCLLESEDLILVKEEEEEGNKMGFGQRWLIPSFLLTGVGAVAELLFQGFL